MELLNNGAHQTFEETQLEAIESFKGIEVRSKDKSETSFYHVVKVAEVAKALCLSVFAKVEDNKVVFSIF